jgi:hypothetical protein
MTDMNTLLLDLSQNQKPRQFDIAVILYKICHEKYSCKCLKPNIWINKTDTTIGVEIVIQDIMNEITITIKNSLIEYNKNLSVKSKEYKTISKLIDKITSDKYVKEVIKEASELFYNN